MGVSCFVNLSRKLVLQSLPPTLFSDEFRIYNSDGFIFLSSLVYIKGGKIFCIYTHIKVYFRQCWSE